MPDLASITQMFRRLREQLGWPLLAALAAAVMIVIALAVTPGDRTQAAPAPAPAAAKPAAETPAMGEVPSGAPKKPSPAIPKKPRRR